MPDRYPSDPSNPMKVLEERLRLLEVKIDEQNRRNPLNFGRFSGTLRNVDEAGNTVVSLSPGGVSMVDETGQLRVRIGLVDTGSYGVLVLDADGVTSRLLVDESGIRAPYLATPFVQADDYATVTSASFVVSHRAQVEQVTSEGLYAWVTCGSDAGTTGEMRLHNVATGAVTEAVSVPAGSAGTVQQFRWLHGAPLSAGPVVFEVQARRTGGTGDVRVYRSPGCWMTDPGLCVADGVA